MPDENKHTGEAFRRYNASELITSINHEALIQAKLERLKIGFGPTESFADVGLSKITLLDVDTAARTIVEAVGPLPADIEGRRPRTTSALDEVLSGLRALFAAESSGWSPSLGKNRLVGPVTGVGEISHGGTGDPVKAPEDRRPGPRLAGPGAGVRVGILDSPLSPLPWLTDGWRAGWRSRIPAGTTPPYAWGHATFVTGLILSQAPSATVEVSSVLNEPDGSGDSWTLAREIVRMGNSGVDILNLSVVCYTDDGEPPMALSAAIDRLDPEVVVVAAAGNHGNEESEKERTLPSWPAALDDVVAVGSAYVADDGPRRCDFTPDAPWVDVLADGDQLISTFPLQAGPPDRPEDFDGWAQWSGTSFSAALVSGALAASVQPGRVTARQALDDLRESARPPRQRLLEKTMAPYLPMTLL